MMGLLKLNERLNDPFLAPYFGQLLPRDHPRKTRFAINFFTSIGLGGLTYVDSGPMLFVSVCSAILSLCAVTSRTCVAWIIVSTVVFMCRSRSRVAILNAI